MNILYDDIVTSTHIANGRIRYLSVVEDLRLERIRHFEQFQLQECSDRKRSAKELERFQGVAKVLANLQYC